MPPVRHGFLAAYGMPSSVIAHINYYPESSTLRVTYTSGEIYDYLMVPVSIYEAMKQAWSKGKYLNTVIKGRFQYKKLKRET